MRFIVKIGTSLLTNEDNSLNTEFITKMVEQLAKLHKEGHEPIIVTSGAVAAGRKSIEIKKEGKHIPYRQALASIGQTYLLETYQNDFAKHDIVIGQVLLTLHDFTNHKNFLSTHSTLERLLHLRVIPVVNENDVTTIEELRFGDNDNLSAHLASLLEVDKLIILTDVKGLYDKNPKKDPKAKLIKEVKAVDDDVKKLANKGDAKSDPGKGMGGIVSKITAAEYATEAGVETWVCLGGIPNGVADIVKGEKHHGTRFAPQFSGKKTRGKWLQFKQKKGAIIIVDQGAKKALLEKGKSLLPSGVKTTEGRFERGDVVQIMGDKGGKIGFGQINYSSKEMDIIKGSQSAEIGDLLGYALEDEIIHRDNMVT